MEPWQDSASNVLFYAFGGCVVVGTIVNLVACYHYLFRTHKWWTLIPHLNFNEVEHKIFKVSLAFFGMAIIALLLLLLVDGR